MKMMIKDEEEEDRKEWKRIRRPSCLCVLVFSGWIALGCRRRWRRRRHRIFRIASETDWSKNRPYQIQTTDKRVEERRKEIFMTMMMRGRTGGGGWLQLWPATLTGWRRLMVMTIVGLLSLFLMSSYRGPRMSRRSWRLALDSDSNSHMKRSPGGVKQKRSNWINWWTSWSSAWHSHDMKEKDTLLSIQSEKSIVLFSNGHLNGHPWSLRIGE